jgi:hypothetical protein
MKARVVVVAALLLAVGSLFSVRASVWADGQLLPSNKARIILVALSFVRGDAAGDLPVVVIDNCDTGSAMREMEGRQVNGQSLRFWSVPGRDVALLRARLEGYSRAIVFYCGDSDRVAAGIGELGRSRMGLVTVSDNPRLVADHFMMGVEVREARASLLINMPKLRAVDTQLDPRIFSVARVIQ